MRKFLFACVAVFGLTNITAQEKETVGGFEKGDVFISGSVNFNSTSISDVEGSDTNFTLSPSVGYFLSDNIAIELGLAFGSSELEGTFGDSTSSTFGVTLGADYYFTPANKFSFVVGAGVSYITQGSEVASVDQPDVNTFVIAAAPGVNYFVSESFALRASVGALSYATTKQDVDGANSFNRFGFNLDLSSVNIGLTYKF